MSEDLLRFMARILVGCEVSVDTSFATFSRSCPVVIGICEIFSQHLCTLLEKCEILKL